MAGFEAEVGGGLVAEELVGAGDDVGVDGDHALVVVCRWRVRRWRRGG